MIHEHSKTLDSYKDKKPKVLIVDDIPDNIKVLQYDLEDEGYQVISAACGSEALDLAKSELPDVILLDMMMPGMNGLETCEGLKADAKSEEIPVIMVSANSEEETVVSCLDAGAQDYVTKPFSFPIVAARVRSAVRIKKSREMIAELNIELISLSITDDLTGLYNRRYFNLQFPVYFSVAQRNNNCVSVFMIDVDHFKKYNDTYGHPEGDECLMQVSGAIASVFKRGSDVVARYGGEEFIVVASGTESDGAKEITAKLLDKIDSLSIKHKESEYGRLTVSIGYISIIPGSTIAADELIKAADNALYLAKDKGRNRAVESVGLETTRRKNSGAQISQVNTNDEKKYDK